MKAQITFHFQCTNVTKIILNFALCYSSLIYHVGNRSVLYVKSDNLIRT